MKLETFSYLPELTAREVEAQVRSALERGLVLGIEHTAAPDPYDAYWTLWKLPLFSVTDPDAVLSEADACRKSHPGHYVRLNGYDARRQGQVVSFVVHRPSEEP